MYENTLLKRTWMVTHNYYKDNHTVSLYRFATFLLQKAEAVFLGLACYKSHRIKLHNNS